MFRISLIIFVLIFYIACTGKNKTPKGILPQATMREVIWEMIMADEFVNIYIWKNDSSVNRLKESISQYEQIFRSHKITKEQFQKSFTYYRKHPDLFKIIVDSLSKKENSSGEPSPVLYPVDTGFFKKNSLPIQ